MYIFVLRWLLYCDQEFMSYCSVKRFLMYVLCCRESDAPPSEFSLFEALRETIYSEVATLISQNESRPHFLIELFRELQLLTSDYLRQRALYAVQDLVTQYLAEGHKDGPEEKKVRDIKVTVQFLHSA